ncbi:MAG: FAD-dependent oxidoreductase [Suipraeoptans sp.]
MMLEKKFDVIVAGGGTAGISAALSASREGARVLLIEKNAYVGGTAASGLPFIDFFTRNNEQVTGGVAEELMQRLYKEKAALSHIKTKDGHLNSVTMIDPEWIKLVTEEMLLQAGCKILYHSFICDARVNNNALESVIVANKDGLVELKAKLFIDTTGDGDLARFAGAEYNIGREEDGLCQAMSLLFKLGDVNVKKVTNLFGENPIIAKPYGGESEYNLHVSGKLTNWNDIIEKDKIFPHSNHNIWAGTLRENELTYVNTIRVAEKSAVDSWELSDAEIEGRRQLKKIIRFFNEYIPGMENAHITSIQNGIGIRESRRIVGEYILNEDDILSGRKFEDKIAKNGYCIDIHDPKGNGWGVSFIKSEDACYDIPYRCLLPKSIDGLIIAGRCISTTAKALASIRIMPSCMAMGEAAGKAAVICVNDNVRPRDIDVAKLQKKLIESGAIL